MTSISGLDAGQEGVGMSLARIISHSSDCCQELAMDLLARGYAVEIVSPDKIPDNFADLELRVEPPVMNSVRANIAAQKGAYIGSHDFVSHLREPMPDFVRRPPTPEELVASGIASREDRKLAGEIKPPAPVLSQKPPAERAKSPLPTRQPEERLIAAPERVSIATQIRERLRRGITIKFQRPQVKQIMAKINFGAFIGSNPWFLRACAGFAAVVALGVLLVISLRGAGPLVQNAAADSKKTDGKGASTPAVERRGAPTTEVKNALAASQGSREASAQSSTSPKSKSADAKPRLDTSVAKDLKPEKSTVYRDKPSPKSVAAARPGKVRHPHGDGAIAKDTVTYVDKGFAPKNHLP